MSDIISAVLAEEEYQRMRERLDRVLRLYDAMGRQVKTLLEGDPPAGVQRIRVDGAELPAGHYLARLTTSTTQQSITMIVVK